MKTLALFLVLLTTSCSVPNPYNVYDLPAFYKPPVCDEVRPQTIPQYSAKKDELFVSAYELLPCLKIGNDFDYQWFSLYEFRVNNIKAGDIIDTHLAAEVTNDLLLEIMFDWRIEIQDENGNVVNATQPFGTNITPQQHHWSFTHGLAYQFNKPGSYRVLAKILAAGAPTDSIAYLIVEHGYGQLQGVLHR